MRISVLGLGYVGVVVEANKVALLYSGKAAIIEKDIDQIIAQEVAAGRLSATAHVAAAVPRSDLIMVCVGTPSRSNGEIDLKHVRHVCEQIGTALRTHPGAPVVVMRSTLLPGTTHDVVLPTLEASSGRQAGTDFGLCVNPEFLREGSAVQDYLHPPKTVIGELNRASGDLLASLYASIAAPLVRTDIETAEMVKYADNAWHALKVGILGFSFKAGTDDLRESPVVELTERLIGKGYDLRIYDGNVRLASIHGANRDYILHRIPHISRLMVDSIDEVLEHADTIVIGNGAPEFRDLPRRLSGRQTVIDFVRVTD